MDDSKTILLYMQVAISVATLVLTPIFSALVVSYQLSRNQSYWKEQQRYLKESEAFKTEIDLFRRAVGVANRLHEKLVNHQIYASSRDLALAFAQELAQSDAAAAQKYQQQFEEYRKTAAQSYLDFRELSIETRQEAASLNIFFSEDISESLTAIADKANAGLAAGLPVGDIRARLRQQVQQGVPTDAAQATIQQEIENRQEIGRPKVELLSFLEKISKSMIEAKPNT
jgi:hypothetical protein